MIKTVAHHLRSRYFGFDPEPVSINLFGTSQIRSASNKNKAIERRFPHSVGN